MQSLTAYQSYANMMQNYQVKEITDYKADSEIKFEIPYIKEEKVTKSQEVDNEVADFLKNLREKGSAKFLADLNQEKIDKLVEEYKQKLIDNMGDSPDAMQEIAKLVEDFKKKLMEEMKEKMEDKVKDVKNKNALSSNDLLSSHLNSPKKATPLEELLKL